MQPSLPFFHMDCLVWTLTGKSPTAPPSLIMVKGQYTLIIFQMHKQLKKALHELQEEKEMNKCLLENQSIWQHKVTGLETQIRDLAQTKDTV